MATYFIHFTKMSEIQDGKLKDVKMHVRLKSFGKVFLEWLLVTSSSWVIKFRVLIRCRWLFRINKVAAADYLESIKAAKCGRYAAWLWNSRRPELESKSLTPLFPHICPHNASFCFAIHFDLESRIYNLEFRSWNLKSGIQALESGIYNLKSGIYNLKSRGWNLKCGK